MPMHDWKRVDAGIYHAFHHNWVSTLSTVLNGGLLPQDYYALPEQQAAGFGPDVPSLQRKANSDSTRAIDLCADDDTKSSRHTPCAVSLLPPRPEHIVISCTAVGNSSIAGHSTALLSRPQTRFTAESSTEFYRRKKSSVAIRHVSGDRIVAMVELMSPGNKSSRHALHAFVEKACGLLEARVNLLILDPFPPTARDPNGIHAAIWEEVEDAPFQIPADKPLMLVAYECGLTTRAYIEPIAGGDVLPDMPLFLEPDGCVSVPLEATYQTAFQGMPARWRTVLEAPHD